MRAAHAMGLCGTGKLGGCLKPGNNLARLWPLAVERMGGVYLPCPIKRIGFFLEISSSLSPARTRDRTLRTPDTPQFWNDPMPRMGASGAAEFSSSGINPFRSSLRKGSLFPTRILEEKALSRNCQVKSSPRSRQQFRG